MIGSMTQPRAVELILAQQVKLLREQYGRSQDDVARGARHHGLRWTRATVAALELGRRRLSALETLLLPAVLNYGLGINSSLDAARLIPEKAVIQLPDGTLSSGEQVRKMISGEARTSPSRVPGTPEFRQVEAIRRRRKTREQGVLTEREASGDAEQKAATKLKRTPFEVAVAARSLWGRSLTAERDDRVAKQAPYSTLRARHALRGHVTRALLLQLKDHMAATSGNG